jgi:hypothetical protein
MSQLGTIMSRLSRVHFDEIGSLFEDKDGNFSVGECLSPVLTWQSRDSVDAEINRGPFTQEDCYLGSLISALTTHAEELPLTPYLFFSPLPEQSDYPSWDSFKAAVDRRGDFVFVGGKLESSKNRLSYFIAGQILEEMVPLLLSRTTHFTLSHPDLHLGNIFVDDELNITCIIDWGSAITGPITELLATPGLAGPSNPPAPCLTASFQAGFCQESGAVERDLWGRAEMMWSFSRLVRLLSGQDLNLFSALYELVYNKRGDASSDTINCGRLFYERAMLEANKQLLPKLGEYDLTDEELREMERASFPPEKSDRLAVARKLTLMSEMNPGFVGDRRLWRWLEDSLQDDI